MAYMAKAEKSAFFQTFELFPEAVLIVGNRGKVLYFNPAAERLFRFQNNEAIGKPVKPFIGKPIGSENYQTVQNILKKKGFWSGDTELSLYYNPSALLAWSLSRIDSPLFDSFTYLAVAREQISKAGSAATYSNSRQLEEIIRKTPLGVHMYELQDGDRLVFIGYNQAAQDILGLDHQHFIGKTIDEAFPNLKETEIPTAYRMVALRGESYSGVSTFRDELGVAGSYELTAFSTGPSRMAVFFSDVTEKEKIKEVLEEKQDQLRSFFDNSLAAIQICDEEGRIAEWNHACERLLGVKRSKVIGRYIWDVTLEVMPSAMRSEAYRSYLRQVIIETLRVGKMLFPEFGEYEAITFDNRAITLQQNHFLFKSHKGHRLGVVLIDVTERKQAETALRLREEMLSSLTRNLPGVVFRFYGRPDTRELGLYHVSDKARTMFGLESKFDDFLQDFIQRIHPDDQGPFVQSIYNVLDRIGPWEYEGRYLHPDGSLIWFRGISLPIRAEKEIVFDGIILNITEQKLTETTLRLREEMLSGLTQNLPGAVYRFYARPQTGEMGIYYVSEKMRSMFGIDLPLPEFFPEFYRHIHPDDQERFMSSIHYVVEHCIPWEFEGRFIHNDGSIIWVKGISQPIRLEKEIVFDGILLNITEQKLADLERERAGNELRRSEERYRNFISNAGEGIFRIDFKKPIPIDQPYEEIAAQIAENAVIAEVNEALSRMYSLKPEEMVGLPVKQFAPNCGFQMADLLNNENYRTTELESLEYIIDGQPIYIVESFSAVIENGMLKRVWGVQRDVTERKKMELAIQESEKRLTDIFNRVQDALIIHDLQGNIINVNETMLRMYDVNRESALKMTIVGDLTGPGNPIEQTENFWKRAVMGETLSFEWNARRPRDNYYFSVEVRLSRIKLGSQDCILANIRDISERKEAEKAIREKTEELDRYFTSSLDLLCIADTDGNFRRLNPEWENLLGYDLDELVGQSFLRLVHPEDLQPTLDAIAELSDQVEILNFTNRYLCKNGEYRWLEWRSYPSDNLIYAVARDITEHKQIEKMLQESEERAQRLRTAAIKLATDQTVAEGDIDGAARMITETVAQALDVSRAGVWMISDDEREMKCIDQYDAQRKEHSSGTILKAKQYPRYFEALKMEKAINTTNAQFDSRTSEFRDGYLIPQGITSMLDAGFFVAGKLMGVVCHEHIGEPREWKPDEIAFSGTAADQMAQAFANAERKRAEDALRHNEMKYRSYVDYAPVGVFVVDQQGHYMEVNEAACKITGYEKEELLEKSLSDILPEDEKYKGYEHFLQVVEKGFAGGEFAFLHKNGMRKYWMVDAVRLSDERFLGFTTDITQRKQDENTRRLNEIRREAMLGLYDMSGRSANEITDYTLEAVVRITDSELGYIAFMNESEDVLTMYSWSKIAMAECAVLNRTLHYPLDTTGLWGEAVRQRRPIVTNDYQADNPYKRGYPEGHVKVTRHLNLPIFDGEKIVSVVGVGNKVEPYNEEDISQITLLLNFMWSIIKRERAEESLRESEEKYRSLVETTDTGFVIINGQDGLIVEANDIYCRLAGRESVDEIIGHSVIEWTAEYDKQRNDEAVRKCLEKGYTRHFTVDYNHPDGNIVTIEVNATVLQTQQGPILLSLCRDVTEVRQQEARLRHQQKLESIGTLAGGIAHEINNPINIILNYAQLMVEAAPQNSQTALDAQAIVDESRRIAGIVKNLLAFSRQENERHSPALISDIVDSTLSLTQKLISKDQIQVDLHIADNIPRFKCRSQQIMQVLMNLITNARDALNQKYPAYDENKRIVIECFMVEHDNRRWVRTIIEDFGVGIPYAIRDRLYDPFFTTKPKDQGTGLGLSITHGIIKEHKGQLWFESEIGQSTKFIFDLPLDNGWDLASIKAEGIV